MRFSRKLLAGAVAGLTAFAAAAQESAEPPADSPAAAKAEPKQRLSDVEQTVEALPSEQAEPAGQAAPEAEAAPAPPAEAPPLSRAQIAAIEQTMERGQLLVAIARGGIVATRDMLTRLSDPDGVGIRGWIAEPAGNSTLVTFYADGTGASTAPRAVYRATVLGSRVTSREIFLGDDRPALTPPQARMAAARGASENGELQACTDQPFNVLVVPPASPAAPVYVYRISAIGERGRIPLGGHFRSTVARSGSIATHAFAEGCSAIDLPAAVENQPPRPIELGPIADPWPTEVHMLLAQSAGRPLLVTAGDPQRLWLVTGSRIALAAEVAQR